MPLSDVLIETIDDSVKNLDKKINKATIVIKESILERVDEKYESKEFKITTPIIPLTHVLRNYQMSFDVSVESTILEDTPEITSFVLNVPEINIVDQIFIATNGAATITFLVPAEYLEEFLTIKLFALDSQENRSDINTATLPVKEIEIEKPTILVPNKNGLILNYTKGLTVTTTPFSSTLEDTHASSSYKITSDKDGLGLLVNDSEISDLTTHTFSLSSLNGKLVGNTDYYIHVKHIGQSLGSSAWSSPRRFKVRDGVVTKNGRFIYRHESDRGIVIEWELGETKKKLFVYDELAENLPMLPSNTKTAYADVEAEHRGETYHNFSPGRVIYNVGVENTIPGVLNQPTTINNGADDKLCNITDLHGLDSSRSLCNFWFSLNSTIETPLVNYARSIINIPGIDNLDIPSIREMQVILTEFNTNDISLSKTRDRSFFDNKLRGMYLTSNTLRHSNRHTSYHYVCSIEAYSIDESGIATLNTDANCQVDSMNKSYWDRMPNTYEQPYPSFLVRDITNL